MTVITLVGWAGQSAFFSRTLYQWISSEKSGRSLVPPGFWQVSILGSLLLVFYAWDRADHVILTGQILNLAIYGHNLVRDRTRALSRRSLGMLLAVGGLLLAAQLLLMGWDLFQGFSGWLLAGWIGQVVFQMRFPVQWWISERGGETCLPQGFWWLSLCGSGLLMVYALQHHDTVIAAGQAFGWLTYGRNLFLLRQTPAGPPRA